MSTARAHGLLKHRAVLVFVCELPLSIVKLFWSCSSLSLGVSLLEGESVSLSLVVVNGNSSIKQIFYSGTCLLYTSDAADES